MGRTHVDHTDILNFAAEKVNLPKDKADEFREQVRRLRDKLDSFLAEHPDFTLKKMLLSGSLAKGTALRTLNDIDVGCYITGAKAPKQIKELLDYLAERLRTAFPNLNADQIKTQTYCVTISFRGTGLDVDVVPILYDGDLQWYGNLVSQEDGTFLKTSIPLHLEFIRKRKKKNETDFAQIVRLVKYWAKLQKNSRTDFRFKSFMIELILAKLSDQGADFSDYPEALQQFFTYVAASGLKDQIFFTDYYAKTKIGIFSDPVQIIDPVNEKNNASRLYTNTNVNVIVEAALEAGDAIDAALSATTKEKTMYYWQKVFGPSFQI